MSKDKKYNKVSGENKEIHEKINNIFNDTKKEKIVINNLTTVTVVFIILFALYIHVNGDKSIGGGFQSGVIMAVSLILYNFTSNLTKLNAILSKQTSKVIGSIGLLFYLLLNSLAIFFGYEMLDFSGFCYSEESKACHSMGLFLIELSIAIGVFGSILYIYQSFVDFLLKS